MQSSSSQKSMRRLVAAEGYLELGMPKNALKELREIDEAGPLEGPRDFLTGLALKAQQQYAEAVAPLRRAAQALPAPVSQQAWLSLIECYRASGQHDLAKAAQQVAESSDTTAAPSPPEAPNDEEATDRPGTVLEQTAGDLTIQAHVVLTPQLQIKLTIQRNPRS